MIEIDNEIQSDEYTKNLRILKVTVAFLSVACMLLVGLLWLEHSKLVTHENKKSFDESFIEKMIPHQEEAANEADRALNQSEHRELKELAGRIKISSKENIKQMQEWRSAWFSLGKSASAGEKQQ